MPSRDHNGELHVVRGHWDLASAVLLIRAVQPQAHNLGYNLALAGGVLNNGFSDNDLDVLAVPRVGVVPRAPVELIRIFHPVETKGYVFKGGVPSRTIYTFFLQDRRAVDLIIVGFE